MRFLKTFFRFFTIVTLCATFANSAYPTAVETGDDAISGDCVADDELSCLSKMGCIWDETALLNKCQKSICNNESSETNCNNKHGCYYFDTDYDGNNCEVCPKGYCCPTGKSTPQPCTAGYYCPLDGLSNCSTEGFKCTLGQYCPPGISNYALCLAGSYCPTTTEQKSCPNTHPRSDAGSTKQTDCYWLIPKGYQFSTAANGNVQCTAGGYCPYEIKINYPDARQDTWGRAPCNECTDPVNCPVVIQHTPDYDGQIISSPANSTAASQCYAECRDISIEHGKKTANPDSRYKKNINGITAVGISPTNLQLEDKIIYTYNCNYTLTCDTGYETSVSNEIGNNELICTAKKYTVSYDCGEGDGTAPSNGTATYDSRFTPASNTCTKTGYTFDGWTVSGTSDIKNSAFMWQYTENKTLTARWRINTYNLSYVLNGAKDGGSRPATATYDEFFYVSTPSKTGYTFKGWTITGMDTTGHNMCEANHYACISTMETSKSDVLSYIYFKNLTAVDGATVTFTANWTANTYNLSYVLNAGTAGSSAPTTATYDSSFTVSNPTRTGYTFAGWDITGMDTVTHTHGSTTTTSTSISGTKATSFKNLHSTQGATVTFTAKWTANTYTVTLNANADDATAGTRSVTATYDSPMPTPITLPTRAGYTFAGYYDTSDKTGGKQYYTSAGASTRNWDKTSGVTLYARWGANSYTLTYDCGINPNTSRPDGCDPTIGGLAETIEYNASFTVKSLSAVNCKNPGYIFTGWRDNKDKVYKPNDSQTWNYTTDQTFTAQWTACTAGTYCSGDSNTAESCIDIASIFTSDQGSCKKEQCYLKSDLILKDTINTSGVQLNTITTDKIYFKGNSS